MSVVEHETFMRRALELARSVWGATHPNPMVGAVIVEDGHIVGEGATAPDGGPHAERLALLARGKVPRPGATLYVTLEPCSTHGRTGACTDAIIASGIKRVVVGATDPNPAHAGKGFDVLRAATDGGEGGGDARRENCLSHGRVALDHERGLARGCAPVAAAFSRHRGRRDDDLER